ncbi:hypothetical protein MPER_05047 [Moniliophthora perniciosa FA553]|nr:hypothetical protein MPER_05047 [Moniliophthora perniciosa FA553]
MPTGTVDPEQAGGVYQVNQVAIGFGGLMRAGFDSCHCDPKGIHRYSSGLQVWGDIDQAGM